MQQSIRVTTHRAAVSVLAWLVSRALVIVLYATTEWMVSGDADYYRQSLAGLDQTGIGHTLPEYPVPAVALLWVPDGITHLLGIPGSYAWACAGMVLALDAVFMGVLIMRRITMNPPSAQRAESSAAEVIWILALPAIGATALARFDIVPGILVAFALLFAIHHPRFAGAAAAFATAVKYWPAVIIPALLSPSTVRRRLLASGAITGALIAIVAVAWGGLDRLMTPLTYQSDRGLQIESIAATPAVVAWGFARGEPWHIFYASSKSFEIQGPLVGTLQHLSTVISATAVLLLVWLWWRAWQNLRAMDHGRALSGEDPHIPTQLVWLTVASILLFIVTSKVFSPQYLLWILPSTAVGAAILTDPEERRRFLQWSTLLLATSLVTHYIFPLNYGPLIQPLPESPTMALILTVRNLTIVMLNVIATRRAFLATAAYRQRRHPDAAPGSVPQMRPTSA